MRGLAKILGCIALSVLPAAPALAGEVGIPEPATITMFAVGAAGAFIARTLVHRRK